MPRCDRRSRRKTQFTPAEYARLKTLLLAKPMEALLHFKACGIGCLSEVEMFWEIAHDNCEAACRIIHEAAELDMPLGNIPQRARRPTCPSLCVWP